MPPSFPLGPRPTYFLHLAGATRNNTWYVGDTGLTFTLTQPDGNAVAATGYTVRDWSGATVISGAFSGATLVLPEPSGGWKPGWYRLYLTGASTDALFGPSYGVTNFQVIRPNAHFPTNPSRGTSGGTNNGSPLDQVMRGVCSIGPQRYAIADATNPAAAITEIQTDVAIDQAYYLANPDSARPRELLVSFPNGGYDVVGIAGLRGFAKTGVDGSKTFVQVAAGTSSGFKVTVAYPNSGTVVETYDNKADVAAVRAAAGGSAYVIFTGSGSLGTGGPFAIGNTYFNGVKQAVTALYPSVTWFEGPTNEPSENATDATTPQAMRVFYEAVKAGNASAKALGPNHVDESFGAASMNTFLSQGGGNYCDGLSYHAYNMVMGDLNIGRNAMALFAAVIAAYPAQTAGKPIWQTEQGVYTPVQGVYHPRRARWQMLQLLLQEQYGIRREQNHMWYDVSHGFWSQPTWLVNSDQSPNPQVTMTRVLAEEVWGKTFEAALDFGDPGKRMFLGSSYLAGDGTRTLALIAASPLDNPAVTFALTGTPPATLTTVDAFGNTATVAVNQFKRVTVNVPDVPVYVRLPAGVTAAPYQHGTWPPINLATGYGTNLARPTPHSGAVTTSGAARGAGYGDPSNIANGNYQKNGYDYGSEFQSIDLTPNWCRVSWPHANTFDRVLIFSGFPYQAQCALIDFDIQTSTDGGSTWTTQATVTKTASSFAFGSDDNNTGTSVDTFWNEQWIFDVALPAPVRAKDVRLYVRATSMGGAPDAAAKNAGDLADDGGQRLVIAEMCVLSDDSVWPRYAATA